MMLPANVEIWRGSGDAGNTFYYKAAVRGQSHSVTFGKDLTDMKDQATQRLGRMVYQAAGTISLKAERQE